MKKFYMLFLTLLLAAGVASASQIVCIDNVYYDLVGTDAKVTRPDNTPYSGHLYIPSTVEYEGVTYTVVISSTSIFSDIEEVSFGPGFAPGSYRLYNTVDGEFLPPANLSRINLYSFEEPSDNAYFVLNIGQSGKAVAAEAYYEALGKTVVRVKEFNVYGPDGKKLQPFLMADGNPDIRLYPDSDGLVRLGEKFMLDGTYMTVLPMTAYTVVYLYVEYDGKLAAIRLNTAPESTESVSPAGDRLAYAFNNMGSMTVIGFDADADASGDIVIPSSVTFDGTTVDVIGVADKAFMRTGVTGVKFSANMATVGSGAFYGCPDLERVEFAGISGRCTIENYAFAYCGKLNTVTFDDCTGRLVMYRGVFDGTPALTSVALVKGQSVMRPVSEAGLSGVLNAEILENSASTVKVRVVSHFCDTEGKELPVCAFTRVRRNGSYSVHVFEPAGGVVTLPKDMLYTENTAGAKVYDGNLMFGYGVQTDSYLDSPVTDGASYANCTFTQIYVPEEGMPEGALLDNVDYAKTEGGGVAVVGVDQTVTSMEGMVSVPATVQINGTEYNVTSVAPGAFAGCSDIEALSLPEGCVAAGIFTSETEAMSLPDSGERDLGPLSVTLTANSQDAMSLAIASEIWCGTDKLPVCAAIETATGIKAYYPVDGVVTIPVSDFAVSEAAPARAGVADARTVHICFADNALVPGVNDGKWLHTVYVADAAGSGVEGVEADMSGKSEYYDVQGLRVSDELRQGGIYIRRDGNAARKVIVK